MTLTCIHCGSENMDGLSFCGECGEELSDSAILPVLSPGIEVKAEPNSLSFGETPPSGSPFHSPPPEDIALEVGTTVAVETVQSQVGGVNPTPARLVTKTAGNPVSEFALTEESCIVGKFDPDLGPVEVDLEAFPDADYISRNHARIFWEDRCWKVEDNDSANGVFLKRKQGSRFIKVTTAEVLEAGDEISFAKIRFIFQS